MNKNQLTAQNLLDNISVQPHNPATIQRAIYDYLDQVAEDRDLVINVNNPFAYALETSAVNTAFFCQYAWDLNRRQYPAAAMTQEDLYYHMCDKDYIGRFSQPSKAKFTFRVNLDELEEAMAYDPELDCHKVVIMRNTYIEFRGMTFTMEYPLQIIKLNHGGYLLLYKTDKDSEVHTLKTNIVPFKILKTKDYLLEHNKSIDWLVFEIEMLQITVTAHNYPTSTAAFFRTELALKDLYYHAQVYWLNKQGEWEKMLTTHCPDVYDPLTPTAVLKHYPDKLEVYVPDIYRDRGYLSSQIRIILYQTKGQVHMDLKDVDSEEYEVTFRTFDATREKDQFTIPTLNTLIVGSMDILDGGHNGLTFEELRTRVIKNSVGIRDIPISNIQIEDHLEDEGFQIVKNVDQVTNRSYLASKSLPKPTDFNLLTPAAASIEPIFTNLKFLRESNYVKDNVTALTITPDAVYEMDNGSVRLFTNQEKREFDLLVLDRLEDNNSYNETVEEMVDYVNSKDLHFSPFHYVVDLSESVIDMRPYYLDGPTALDKSFIDANDTTALLQVETTGYALEKTPQGYRFTITVESDDNFSSIPDDEIFVQLLFKPYKQTSYAYLQGELLYSEGSLKIYQFDFISNHHVDKEDNIEFLNAKMFNEQDIITKCPLENEFELLFLTTSPLSRSWRSSQIDKKIAQYLLPREGKAVVNERIGLRFGYALKRLWNRSRTIVVPETYVTYPEDIYLTYKEDVLLRDPTSGTAITFTGGQINYTIKHRKGDYVLDANGEKVLIHKKGDVVLDEYGRNVINDPRLLGIRLDILLIEQCFKIANHEVAKRYYNDMIETYVQWIVKSLEDINQRVLEQTKIYFYSRATLGHIKIMYNDGIQASIKAAQSLFVELVVKPEVYNNHEVRELIKDTTTKVIDQKLSQGVVSTNGILTELTEVHGLDVIGIRLKGLGQNDDIIVFTVLEDEKRCSFKKKLVIKENNELFIEEDIEISFIEHKKKD